MSIKVILADDHILIREGIRQLLEFDGSIKVIAEANNGEECLSLLKDHSADVLLLDINMPIVNGIDVLTKIKEERIPVKVLVLTVHNEVEYIIKTVELGVSGYILKDSDLNELKKAITTVYNGESYIQPKLIPAFNKKLVSMDNDKEKLEQLTDRELEVLCLVSNGLFNKEIAEELDISERTVKNHLSNIFKKIDVSDRTQAAVFAIKNDIVKLY